MFIFFSHSFLGIICRFFLHDYPFMKTIFLVGRSPQSEKSQFIEIQLEREQSSYCDLLQFDFNEHIVNNTLKQLHAIQYIYQIFSLISSPPEYLVRTDDDIFFNIPLFVTVLKKMELLNRLVL